MMETHKHSLCHEQPTVTASSDQGSCDLVQQSRSLARDIFSTHISLRKRKAVPNQKASYQYGTLVAAPAAKIGVLSLPWAMDHDPWSPELPNGWQIKAAKPRMMSVSKNLGLLQLQIWVAFSGKPHNWNCCVPPVTQVSAEHVS